eukprot:513283-Pelagomonas_calceolata.AAC.5
MVAACLLTSSYLLEMRLNSMRLEAPSRPGVKAVSAPGGLAALHFLAGSAVLTVRGYLRIRALKRVGLHLWLAETAVVVELGQGKMAERRMRGRLRGSSWCWVWPCAMFRSAMPCGEGRGSNADMGGA